MPSKLEQIKKEIQRLRPEILIDEISHQFGDEYHCDCEVELIFRPITLEDVLAVLGKYKTTRTITWSDKILNIDDDCKWLLGRPLDDQSEETINFLHSLIVK